MALLQEWQKISYNQEQDRASLQKFWQNYFLIEKGIYEQLLDNPDEEVAGTVKELADKYEIDVLVMTGFLDGINDSLITPNPIETMEEDTVVSLAFDKEKLYENMVDAKADWLYELPQWDEMQLRLDVTIHVLVDQAVSISSAVERKINNHQK